MISKTYEELVAEIAAERAAVTPNLLAAIAAAATRDDAVVAYAAANRPYGINPDWRIINKAIKEKWSQSALRYIQNKADRINYGDTFKQNGQPRRKSKPKETL